MWPESLVLPTGLKTTTPFSLNSIGGNSYIATAALGSAVWPLANRAYFVPVRLPRTILLTKMFVYNGAVLNGNLDIGIYSKDGARLLSSGATAQAGINSIQPIDFTALAENIRQFGPGLIYMALAFDGIVATVFRSSLVLGAVGQRPLGMAQMAAAYPLPATAVFATITTNFVPVFGYISHPRLVI